MGELIRGTIAGPPFAIEVGAFALLAAWAFGSLLVTWLAMTRRGQGLSHQGPAIQHPSMLVYSGA
jgi:hypothetical protein